MALPELIANSPAIGQDVPLAILSGNGGMISATANTMNVSAGIQLDELASSGRFRVIIDGEILLIDASTASSGTWNILRRGLENSTPAQHNDGAKVWHKLTVGMLDARYGQRVPGSRAISVTNLMVDPRGTNSVNFTASAGGTGSISQGPTQRTDGYQQKTSPMSCQEIIGTPSAGSFVQFATALRVQGRGMPINVNKPMVASRLACKISGSLGSGWTASLYVVYNSSTGTFLGSAGPIWTGGPNQITLGQWFIMEGFDAQAYATQRAAAWVELAVQVAGSTVGNPVTIRATEFVVAIDSDGDVPGYVGGDVDGGAWAGTPDNSTSTVQFDSLDAYPNSDYGANNFELETNVLGAPAISPLQFTQKQGVAMLREVGANVDRYGVHFMGGNPGAPSASNFSISYMRELIAAGIRIVLNVGSFPSWMAPTHFGLTQSGNAGGSISAAATTMNVTGSLPTNLTLPATFQWNDGSSEVATITALAGGVATITRGSGAVAHNDGVTLMDAQFNLAFGHLYYPDPGYRTLAADSIVNLINILGSQNIYGIEVWNEPSIALDDTRNEGASGYTAFLNAVYDAVKVSFPNVRIFGGVLPFQVSGTPNAGYTDPVAFLNSMFTDGAKYDVLACHFYPSTAAGVGVTPSSGPDWGSPASGFAGFDPGIKRAKDALAANGAGSVPIFVSENGMLPNHPNERVQAQAVALMTGRLWRDPQILGVCNNGLGGGTKGWALYDPNLRPRLVARRISQMRGLQPPSYAEDVVRWTGRSDQAESEPLVDAFMPWTIQLIPIFKAGSVSGDADVIAGTWTLSATASQMLGFVQFNQSNAQNDEIGFQVPLAQGSWTITIIHQKAPTNAIYTVQLDGVAITTGAVIDSYNATTTYNNVGTKTFSVGQSGNHVISLKAATRNASATGWTLAFAAIQLRRTA